MGERLSNALKVLAGGLEKIAVFRAADEEREEARAFQERLIGIQQQHSEKMLENQQAHGEAMLTKQQEFNAAQAGEDRLFRIEMFDRENAAQERRFAQQMAATWASIRQSGANAAAAREDAAEERNLSRQLKVYEFGVNQASTEYQGAVEQMQKEMAEVAKNPMISIDPEKMQAAKLEITERYRPILTEAKEKITENMKGYAEAVGMPQKADFSDVQSGSDRAIITRAVAATKAQLGNSPPPPEANLIAGYKRSGLSDQQARAAARMFLSGSQ